MINTAKQRKAPPGFLVKPPYAATASAQAGLAPIRYNFPQKSGEEAIQTSAVTQPFPWAFRHPCLLPFHFCCSCHRKAPSLQLQ
jgi:hypothetical protein